MGRSRRARARLERKKKTRIWVGVIITVSIMVVGSMNALQQSLAGSADASKVALGPPTAVVQQATPTARDQATPIVREQVTSAVGQQATPTVEQQVKPTTGPLPTLALQVQRITAEDTKALLEKGQAVLYDVRSAEAYLGGHAVGAISFPEAELATLLNTLPADKNLLFYCT